jgi:hypothetical protein
MQGTGIFQGILTQNGGVFAPGSSPGTATSGAFTVNGGGIYEWELSNAAGTEGALSGWDLVNVVPTIFNPTSATLAFTATPSSKYVVRLATRLDSGDRNTPGAAANFNPNQSYAWKFLDADDAKTTITGSFDPAAFLIDTTQFSNATNGTFAIEARDGGKNFYIVYTPNAVPPAVTGIVVNNGNTQRSRLTTIQVNFAKPVDVDQFHAAGAVFLTRTGVATNNVEAVGTVVNNTNGLIITPASGSGMTSSLTLTFQNIDNAGLDFGSLSDGRWALTVQPAGYLAQSPGTQLRRLFGDADNNGTVDASDFSFFPPFGALTGSPFDFNNNNDIDSATDFANFGNRFGYTLA